MDEILVYAKAPVAGRSKSRLARDIGAPAAAGLAAAMLQDILVVALKVPDARVSLWHPPDCRPAEFGELLVQPAAFCCQRGQNLGERMADSFRHVLGTGARRVLLLGSDCISHTLESLQQALNTLNEVDVVLTPAEDGGYVMVGQAKLCEGMFRDIHWGTATVMSTTRQRLDEQGVAWQELTGTFDVDHAGDLPRLAAYCQQHLCPNVERWLIRHADLMTP